MTIYESIPSAVLFEGIRYRANGAQMLKDVGRSTFNWGIPVPAALPTAADGSGGNLAAGTYKIHMVAANKWGYNGNPRSDGPVSVTLSADNHKIAITNIPAFADPQVAYIRFYISYAGTDSPFYYAGEVANGTSSLDITANQANWSTSDYLEPGYLTQDFEDTLAGPFRYGVPTTKRFIEVFDGRIFAAGEKAYTTGLASATDGSDIMTGSAAVSLDSSHVGKWITLNNENISYQITRVWTPQRWQVTRNYERPSWRSSDPSDVQFTITGEASEVIFSEQNYPEYFPSINNFNVGRDEGGAITGIKLLGNELLIATDRSIHAVYRSGSSYQPYGHRRTHSPVGCTAYRSMVVANGAMFFWGGDGFYAYGNDVAVNISKARLGDIFDDFKEDLIPYIIGAYWREKIFWAVPYDDEDYLDRILVYDLKTREWDLDWRTFQIVDMNTIVSRTDGKSYLLINQKAGDNYALLYFDNDYYNDAAYNGDYSGTVDSAASSSITDTSAAFPTGGLGLAGAPLYIWDGTGSGQERRIASNTATTLVVAEPFATQPDTTSKYLVGAIRGRAKSPKETLGHPHDQKTFMELEFGMGAD